MLLQSQPGNSPLPAASYYQNPDIEDENNAYTCYYQNPDIEDEYNGYTWDRRIQHIRPC